MARAYGSQPQARAGNERVRCFPVRTCTGVQQSIQWLAVKGMCLVRPCTRQSCSIAPMNKMTRERFVCGRHVATLRQPGRQVLELFPRRSFSQFMRKLMTPGH